MKEHQAAVPGYLDFAMSVIPAEDVTVVEVQGDLDCYTAPKLRAVLVELADGPRTVILDVGRSQFIDSTGLGVLVLATKRAIDRDVRLVLHSPSERVQQLLELTGLDKVLVVEAG